MAGGIARKCEFDAAAFIEDVRVVNELQRRIRAGCWIEYQGIDRGIRSHFLRRRPVVRLVGVEKFHRSLVPGICTAGHARVRLGSA